LLDLARKLSDGVGVNLILPMKNQVSRILNDKIKRLALAAYKQANPNSIPANKQSKPYTLPSECEELVGMLGRIESADSGELEAMAHFATTGAVRELAYEKA